MITVLTTLRLRFTMKTSLTESLSWASQGSNVIESAPDWITKTPMFRATNGAQLTVLVTEPVIQGAGLKPKKKVVTDDSAEPI